MDILVKVENSASSDLFLDQGGYTNYPPYQGEIASNQIHPPPAL